MTIKGAFSKVSHTSLSLPFGKTTYAFEVVNSSCAEQRLFTIAWPTEKDAHVGAMPTVTAEIASAGLAGKIAAMGVFPANKAGKNNNPPPQNRA